MLEAYEDIMRQVESYLGATYQRLLVPVVVDGEVDCVYITADADGDPSDIYTGTEAISRLLSDMRDDREFGQIVFQPVFMDALHAYVQGLHNRTEDPSLFDGRCIKFIIPYNDDISLFLGGLSEDRLLAMYKASDNELATEPIWIALKHRMTLWHFRECVCHDLAVRDAKECEEGKELAYMENTILQRQMRNLKNEAIGNSNKYVPEYIASLVVNDFDIQRSIFKKYIRALEQGHYDAVFAECASDVIMLPHVKATETKTSEFEDD